MDSHNLFLANAYAIAKICGCKLSLTEFEIKYKEEYFKAKEELDSRDSQPTITKHRIGGYTHS